MVKRLCSVCGMAKSNAVVSDSRCLLHTWTLSRTKQPQRDHVPSRRQIGSIPSQKQPEHEGQAQTMFNPSWCSTLPVNSTTEVRILELLAVYLSWLKSRRPERFPKHADDVLLLWMACQKCVEAPVRYV